MEPGSDHRPPEQAAAPIGEAARRVRLANERTYLAWGRSALGYFALALAVGRIVPELDHSISRWPFEVVGCAYAVLGVVFALYGARRRRVVEEAIGAGAFVEPSGRLLAVLMVLTAIVGAVTFVVLITG